MTSHRSQLLPVLPLVVLLLAACSAGTGDTSGDGGGHGDGSTGMDGSGSGDGSGGDGSGGMDGSGGHDGGTSHHVATCPGCPCFPGTDCSPTGGGDGGTTPPACTGTGATPTLVYPPEGVLLPPNTNVIEIQFLPGTGNTLFEVDFQNAVTDVRVITRCDAITNTRGGATGGCAFSLTNDQWRWVAEVNRGGDPVHVTVRATPDDFSCIGTTATRDISFSTEDVVGAVYYWQSVTVGGVPGTTGGIYRFDFGRTDIAPAPFLVPTVTATRVRCYGCHFLSRDGLRITYGSDDADSDDEYGDLSSYLMDISTRTVAAAAIPAGFRTFSMDHTSLLASDGRKRNTPNAFSRVSGDTGVLIDKPATGARVTHPDWAADDSRVVFAQPAAFFSTTGAVSTTGDDDHFANASLFVAPWSGTALGTSTPLLMAAGADENDYYPAFTPDGAFVVFDRVLGQTGVAGDAFSNPHARVWAMPSTGGAPVDLARLNQGDGLTNSWPRMSPFVQMDRGHRIVWVTFSSTRDYGLRVMNQDPHGVSCYPPESPENSAGSHSCPLLPSSCGCVATGCADFCVQPQIWMAAISLDVTGGISAGVDTSWPAFWLPFQDASAHNHVAQWAVSIPGGPPADGGVPDGGTTCGAVGAPCGPGMALCCGDVYCGSGGTCETLM